MRRMTEASGRTGSRPGGTRDVRPSRRSALVLAVAALGALAALVPTVPAFASARDGARDGIQVTRAESSQYRHWFEGQLLEGSQEMPDMPLGELRAAAELAWAADVPRQHIRAALFTDEARTILAGNAAAGEGRPSPYLAYFVNNPVQLGRLGEFILENRTYAVGPGGTQEQLFASFSGLRDSYLASLGLMEVNGRIVDPRSPYLTPSLASLLMGPPEPLPQPRTALNVDAP